MEPPIPTERRLSDAEIEAFVAEGVLRSKFNPGQDLPYQPGEFLVRIGVNPRNLPPEFHSHNNHNELAFRIAAYCWRLVALGYMVPRVISE